MTRISCCGIEFCGPVSSADLRTRVSHWWHTPSYRCVVFWDKVKTYALGLGSGICASGVVIVATHGAGLPLLAGAVPTGTVAAETLSVTTGCATCCLSGLALLRKRQEGYRLNRKLRALTPVAPTPHPWLPAPTMDMDPAGSLSVVTRKRGLLKADPAQFGPFTYWQYDTDCGSPSLVYIKEYQIDEHEGLKITLLPVVDSTRPRLANELGTLPTGLGPLNESFSPAPYVSPDGEIPPTFCIWAPKKPGLTPMYSSSFPQDYVMFLAGERLAANTASRSIAISCYHSQIALLTHHDPAECYITVGFDKEPIPYNSVSYSKKFPDKFTWLVEPDGEVLEQLKTSKVMPSITDHLNDLVFFEWDFNWSRLPSIKNIRWKVDPIPNSVSTMMSINNRDRIYQYDKNVRVLDDPLAVALTGAALSTAENGEGGSSCKAWRKSNDEWFLVGVHHGGMPNTPGYRNRITPGQVCLQGVKKYEGARWKPVYSQAFEEVFNPLAAHVVDLIQTEERLNIELPPDILQKDVVDDTVAYTEAPLVADDFREAVNESYHVTAVNEGVMSRSQWQNTMKTLYKKTKSHKLSRALLYHSTSANIAQYDPDAAAMATYIMASEKHFHDLRDEYRGFAEFLEREAKELQEGDRWNDSPNASLVSAALVHDALAAAPGSLTLAVAKSCKVVTKSQINPTLYHYLREGLVVQGPGSSWSLTPGSEARWAQILGTAKKALGVEKAVDLPVFSLKEEAAPAASSCAPAPEVPVDVPVGAHSQRADPIVYHMVNEAPVDWTTYKTTAEVDLTPETEQAVAGAKAAAKAKAKASPKKKKKSTKNDAINHAPCFNEAFAHDIYEAPHTDDRDYSVINAQFGLDGCFPGYTRFYPLPITEADLKVIPDDRGHAQCKWITSSGSTPFPRDHLPRIQNYCERVDSCTPMPVASRESQEHFEFFLKQFLDYNGGDYMSMKLEVFGQLLSAIAGTLDGSLQHTTPFQVFLAKQTLFQPRTTNVQPNSKVDPLVARFFGLAPYNCNQKSKDWHYHPAKDGWFEEWADACWDDETNRPAGACAARGPEFVRKSINAQFRRKKMRTREYSFEHLQEYSRGLPAPVWDGEVTLSSFLQAIFKGVQAAKGTAWGKCTGERTKGEWITDKDNVLSVVYRIMLVAATQHDMLIKCSPLDLFQAGLVVPEELFGKDEIHLNKKVDGDRLRAIWNAGVAGELVMRFFHNAQNKLEIELFQGGETHSTAFPYFGSCVGMGHHDEGNAELCSAMRNMLGGEGRSHNGVSTDPSGWDISVTRALWMADAYRRADAARFGYYPYGWCYALMNMGLISSAHVMVIGKEMFELLWFGVMPSGIPSTSSSNSFMRGFIHSEAVWTTEGRVGVSLSMGDDNHAKDETKPVFQTIWHELGVLIEDSGATLKLGEPISFTSHLYDLETDAVSFDNGPKILLRLAYAGHHKLTRDQATGIRFAVRHTSALRERVDNYVGKANSTWLDVDIHDPDVVMDFDTVF